MDVLPHTASTLWAMHPDYLSAFLKQGSIEAMLPEALKSLASAFKPEGKAKADPIRTGATVIIPVRGALGPSSMGGFRTPTDWISAKVTEFAADEKVGAIVLDIASPGGYVYGNKEAGDAIYAARQSKPVIAVASPFAFSAAHWLACQCTAFYASPSAEVGSVGVRGGHVDVSGFEDKIGMKTTLIASSPDKIAAHPYAPLSEDDAAMLQAIVDEENLVFIDAIARGRGMKAADVPAMHGQGATFSARKAAELGITDGVMTLNEVVAKYSSSRSRLDLMRRKAVLEGQSIGL